MFNVEIAVPKRRNECGANYQDIEKINNKDKWKRAGVLGMKVETGGESQN